MTTCNGVPGDWYDIQFKPYKHKVPAGESVGITPKQLLIWKEQEGYANARELRLFVPHTKTYEPVLVTPSHTYMIVALEKSEHVMEGMSYNLLVQNAHFRFWPPAKPGQTIIKAYESKAKEAGATGFVESASVPLP